MCGIAGIISFQPNETHRDTDKQHMRRQFTHMLTQAGQRGRSATGAMLLNIEEKPKIYVAKAPLPVDDFVKTKVFINDILGTIDKNTISTFGHTRAVGPYGADAKNNFNNHPHISGPIVGIHNGFIDNADSLWRSKVIRTSGLTNKSSCDSEVIFALINAAYQTSGSDLITVVRDICKMLKGAYAFVFYNAHQSGNITIVKNKERPLDLIWAPTCKHLLVASDRSYVNDTIEFYKSSKLITLPSEYIIEINVKTMHSTQDGPMVRIERLK